MKNLYNKLLTVVVFTSLAACHNDFLNLKMDQSQVIPASVADYQALLDNWRAFNTGTTDELNTIGSDEYYLTDEAWELLTTAYHKNGYIWADNVYEQATVDDWNEGYHRILIANMVLDGLGRYESAEYEMDEWSNVMGSALFFRAYNHYNLVQTFGSAYHPETADKELGIVLRLESDITLKPDRSTLKRTFASIAEDLIKAAELLPVQPSIKFRPSRPAAYALLSRVYLTTQDYGQAAHYANLCLELNSELVDFNDLDTTLRYIFPSDNGDSNPEVLFFCYMDNIAITNTARFNADTVLLDRYEEGDLRRTAYFYDTGQAILFRASYRGGAAFFTGLATDEVYLIRAESYAREGKLESALADLNYLRSHRFSNDNLYEFHSADPKTVLEKILEERHKELYMRGLRWQDLKRLNLDASFQKTLVRRIGDREFLLPPNDPRYAWQIPDDELSLNGLQPNKR